MALLGGENRILTQRGITKIKDLVTTDKIITVDGVAHDIHTFEQTNDVMQLYKIKFLSGAEIYIPRNGALYISGLVYREKLKIRTAKEIWDYYRSYEKTGKRRHVLYSYRHTPDLSIELQDMYDNSLLYIVGFIVGTGKTTIKNIAAVKRILKKYKPDVVDFELAGTNRVKITGLYSTDVLEFDKRIEILRNVICLPEKQFRSFMAGFIDSSSYAMASGVLDYREKNNQEYNYLVCACFSRCGFAYKRRMAAAKREHVLLWTRYPDAVFTVRPNTFRYLHQDRTSWYDPIKDIKYMIQDRCYNLIIKDSESINIEYGMYSVPNI